jgi:hypothetical protein
MIVFRHIDYGFPFDAFPLGNKYSARSKAAEKQKGRYELNRSGPLLFSLAAKR